MLGQRMITVRLVRCIDSVIRAMSNCSLLPCIKLRYNILYHNKLTVIDFWERIVYCLFCNSMATLKPTKTGCIMLRCNTCGALVFANGILSQQRIQM